MTAEEKLLARLARLEAETLGLRQVVARLALALIAGGVPRAEVEAITGAPTPTAPEREE